MKLIDELRAARPKLGKKADYEGSAKAAIYLACLECMGGSRSEIKSCGNEPCPLWPYRLGTGKQIRTDPVAVPTKEWYEEEMERNISDELRQRGYALRQNGKEDE